MAWRFYIAPPDDPNGHAGQVIWTDDQGNFQIGGNNPETGQPPGATNGTPQGSSAGSVPSGAGAGGVVGAVSGLVDPNAIKALMDLASQNAQQAYLNARLQLEKESATHQWTTEQEQLAQAAAHDAWTRTVAQQQQTGYTGGIGDVAQRVTDAWNRLAPAQKTAANATAIWQSQVPGLTTDEAARMAEAGHQYAAINGVAMPADIMQQTLSQITGGRITGQGTPTLQREQEQNQTGLGLLDLASRLRGPDNAFAYARTLQNVPPEMRAQLDAMMGRAGISYAGPGLATVAGQLASGSLGGIQTGTNALTAQGAPMAGALAAQGAPAGATQTGGNYMTYANPTPGGSAGGATQATGGATQTAQVMPGMRSVQGVASAPGVGTAPPITGLGQISPQQWGQTNDYVKRLMLAGLEAGGADKSAELSAYQLQLPSYGGPTTGRVAA